MPRERSRAYTIGLTGNIATGKSTVARILAELGAYVIDADLLVHELLRPGSGVHRGVIERFGPDVVRPTGEIDRAALGAIVFADPAALADLERLVHPAVVRRTLELLARSEADVRVIEAIKLLEAEMQRHCDAVWVVVASRELQMRRLMETRGLSLEEAQLRIDAQPPAEEKVARADVVIDNGSSLEETRAQVEQAWRALPTATTSGQTHRRTMP